MVNRVEVNLNVTNPALDDGQFTPPMDDKHLFRPQMDGETANVSTALDHCALPTLINQLQTDNTNEELSQILQCSIVEDTDVPPPGCDIDLSRPLSPSCVTDFPYAPGIRLCSRSMRT